jgi:hypothetical protein
VKFYGVQREGLALGSARRSGPARGLVLQQLSCSLAHGMFAGRSGVPAGGPAIILFSRLLAWSYRLWPWAVGGAPAGMGPMATSEGAPLACDRVAQRARRARWADGDLRSDGKPLGSGHSSTEPSAGHSPSSTDSYCSRMARSRSYSRRFGVVDTGSLELGRDSVGHMVADTECNQGHLTLNGNELELAHEVTTITKRRARR